MGKTTTEIIQLKSLDAPPRRDEDFLTYYSLAEKNVEDNHCKNKDHPSPFYPRFSLVRGFAIEPMHTAYGGAFFRFLYGLVYERDEGTEIAIMERRRARSARPNNVILLFSYR